MDADAAYQLTISVGQQAIRELQEQGVIEKPKQPNSAFDTDKNSKAKPQEIKNAKDSPSIFNKNETKSR